MTQAEQAAWWLMTFGAGEVPLKEAFLVMRRSKMTIGQYTDMREAGLLEYISCIDRPDSFRITEAGIEAINAGN
jgi:hypothetical protein